MRLGGQLAACLAALAASCASAPPEERASAPEPEPSRPGRAEVVAPASDRTSAAPPERMGERGPWTDERTLESAPYDEPGAPSVIVHAPPGFDPARPLRLVVFLHGWSGCARVLVHAGPTACKEGEREREGWGLAARVDEAGTDALFVVPQLAFMRRSGHPGRFSEPGRFRAFLGELLTSLAPRIGPGRALADVEGVTLLAHSAGFEAALAILRGGGVEVGNVVLFDALYAGVEPFAAWALGAPDRRLVSLYTGGGRTARQSRRLARRLDAAVGDGLARDREASPAARLREARVLIARSTAPHGQVPARHIPELLGPLGLSTRR